MGMLMTDARKFRDALGKFVTGVAVVTALNDDGDPIGVTVNSFSSVSLDPPLVLWSLTNKSPNLEAFRNTSHFVINILASDQEHVSNQFARPVQDRFANVDCKTGLGGVPVIAGTLACFECENAWTTEGGDHTVFFGKVIDYDEADRAPLLFFSGKYGTANHAK